MRLLTNLGNRGFLLFFFRGTLVRPLDTADKQSVPRDRAPEKRKCNIHMYNLSIDHFNSGARGAPWVSKFSNPLIRKI